MCHETLLYAWGGVHTIGWYSDFGPDYDADGHPYFFYAYKVDGVTYGGRALYDDETSDIYYRNVGDAFGVTYLRKKPWISTGKPIAWNLHFCRLPLMFLFLAFVVGIWFSVVSSKNVASHKSRAPSPEDSSTNLGIKR
jgi:hypothetical protein